MRRVVAGFIRYPVWSNLLLLAVLLFGLLNLLSIRYSFFPELPPDIITIQVAFPGASPEEVEEGVVLKIEEAIEGIEGVERITSLSRENFGTVTVEVMKDADLEQVLRDVKNAVDQINSFPQDIERPVIFEQKFRTRALSIVLYGHTDLYHLKYIAEEFRDELLATPEISQVTIEGVPRLEFSIELSEADLQRYGLTFQEVAEAVRNANLNITGGKIDTPREELLIRAFGRKYFARELLNVPVRGISRGDVVYLREVARVRETWEDVPNRTYYNGKTAVVLNVDQVAQEDILKIVNRAYALVAEFNRKNQEVQAVVLDDRTIPLRQRLELLVKNGLIGLVLVLLSLGFFMNLRLSFWVSVGIPFSFAGMFIVAHLVGLTINVISLFGMILVVGILVDDAIVVGENIYAHYEKGEPALRAAVNGTMEVIAPVATSVTTTIIAFLPFFFLDGFIGKFIWHMAVVVIASLAFSLVEAFFVLPSHLAHSRGLHPHEQDPPLRQHIEKFIHSLTHRYYAGLLRWCLQQKWVMMALPVALILFTIGLMGGGFIGATFFPYIDRDTLPINISMVSGTQEDETDSLLAHIEQICWQVNQQLKAERPDGRDVILAIKRDVGINDFGEQGSHAGRLTLQLLEGEKRQMEGYRIAGRIRQAIGPLPGVRNASFGQFGFFGKPVSISLLGKDLQEILKARDLLMAELENFRSLKDVTHTYQEGRREVRLTLKPRAHALGLQLADVAGQVRQAFFGQEVQRIQRGRDEIRIWVRYRPEDRAALSFLDRMRIRTPDGGEYPLSELASYTITRGVVQISHLNRFREVRVEAELADVEEDLPPILAEIRQAVLPKVLARVHGVRASFEGQSRDQQKALKSMKRAFPIALAAMFVLVVVVFRSYLQALLIFSLIPIGVLGAIWGHGIMGKQVNILSMYGIIALSGIIINDSIVLVDKVNRNLRSGMQVLEAVYQGAISRLRPILLTTLTTALGLAPIMMETSRQAQFLIPMAISVAFGLIFGTVILLLILPAAFLVLNRFRMLWATLLGRPEITPESVEPAVQEVKNRVPV